MIEKLNKKPSELLEKKAKESGIIYPKITVSEALEKNNEDYLDDIAIDFYGNKITYGELLKKRDEYAKAFLNYGIKKGDCVSACLGTLPESIYIFYGLNKIGAKFYPLLPMWNTEQIVNALKANKSNIFFTLDSLYYRVGDALIESGIPTNIKMSAYSSLAPGVRQLKLFNQWLKRNTYKNIPKDFLTIKDFLKSGEETGLVSCEWYDGKIAAVTSSAGTTGLNKATELTDFGFNAMVENYKVAFPELYRGQTFHSTIPILFSTGISNSINLPLQLGLTTILEPVYDRKVYPDRVLKTKANLHIAPVYHAKEFLVYLRKLYKEGNIKNRDLLNFINVYATGGSSMPVPWKEELEFYLDHFGSNGVVGEGYGLSEHNSALVTNGDTSMNRESPGKVLPGVIMGAFDINTGEELGFGEIGRIKASSPADMGGYFGNQELTDKYFVKDGTGTIWGDWGHTGDMGKFELIDGDVWFHYMGREELDVINIETNPIYLHKILSKIFEYDDINDCAVVKQKHNGETVPVAHIELKSSEVSEIEVLSKLELLFSDVESNEKPFAYKIHEELPVLTTGKPDRESLEADKVGYIKLLDNEISHIDINAKTLKKAFGTC